MRLFARYLFGQAAAALVLILLSLTGVVWIATALKQLNVVTGEGQQALQFIKMTLLAIPNLMAIIAPVALLIAALHTLNKLNGDSELIVMTAAGATIWSFARPLLTIAGGLAIVLLVANHTSWLDIVVLSALAPVSFVAKKEVGGWPFVSSLARLQRTVFVDRNRRQSAGDAADEITARLDQGDTIVLFAEGTSSDGNRVLPFKTSLFGAVLPGGEARSAREGNAVVQTAAIVYTHLHGVSLGRADRPRVGWYGDMEMQSHAWAVLQSGPLAVTVRIGTPVPLEDFADRKELARKSEREVRHAVHAILRGRKLGEAVNPVEPGDEARKQKPAVRAANGEKWT